jgi:hypothetical protein
MSAAETSAAPLRRFTSRFLRSELRLIAVRRRNQVGLAALAAIPIVLAVAIKVAAPDTSDGAPDFVGQIAGNGFFVALAALPCRSAASGCSRSSTPASWPARSWPRWWWRSPA